MVSVVVDAVRWALSTRLGRGAVVIVGAIFAILTMRALWKRQGAKDARRKLYAASTAASVKRRTERDETDARALRSGSADRLRDKWSRG